MVYLMKLEYSNYVFCRSPVSCIAWPWFSRDVTRHPHSLASYNSYNSVLRFHCISTDRIYFRINVKIMVSTRSKTAQTQLEDVGVSTSTLKVRAGKRQLKSHLPRPTQPQSARHQIQKGHKFPQRSARRRQNLHPNLPKSTMLDATQRSSSTAPQSCSYGALA